MEYVTLISDLGTEFTSKCLHEICKHLHIAQDFTPSFSHHCLGACERTHRSIAERLTPYLQNRGTAWNEVLSSITFSINQSVHSGMGYSPHEIVFGHRPKFPLSTTNPSDFNTVPSDMKSYLRKQIDKLNIIRSEVKNNVTAYQQKMIDRAKLTKNILHLSPGDFVYLTTETKGTGQNFQNRFTGPFVVDNLPSSHLVTIRNIENGQLLKTPVHINRLKMAYVRQPNPSPYFIPKVETCEVVQPNEQIIDQKDKKCTPAIPRSSRQRKEPDRLGLTVNLSDVMSSDDVMDSGYHKIKRILGQKCVGNEKQYLVQFRGEPAENAVWVPLTAMSQLALKQVREKPPPVIVDID